MTNIEFQTLQRRHIEVPRGLDGMVVGLLRLSRTLVETLLTWQRRAVERNRLATLEPRLLADMGISEAAAAREAAIPFWRLK